MFNVGGGEFLIILLVALVVLGPTRLPEAARQVGKVVGEFRRLSAGFQREMQQAIKDPVSKVTGTPTPRKITDITKTAAVPKMDDDPSANQDSDTPSSGTPAGSSPDTTDTDSPNGERNPRDDSPEPPEAPMYSDR